MLDNLPLRGTQKTKSCFVLPHPLYLENESGLGELENGAASNAIADALILFACWPIGMTD